MSNKTIVTIDFDYIMSPCIKLYNDMCGGDANPTECWDRIEIERRINNHISYIKLFTKGDFYVSKRITAH